MKRPQSVHFCSDVSVLYLAQALAVSGLNCNTCASPTHLFSAMIRSLLLFCHVIIAVGFQSFVRRFQLGVEGNGVTTGVTFHASTFLS